MLNDKELYFNIGNLTIPYNITESKKAKHIKLVMDISGLRVVKPLRAKIDQVEMVLKEKSNWVYKHYMNFQSLKVEEYNREWKSGERVLYRGGSII